tara:strand:- start:322 stop:669 length:348 start_codon:yes stop_codon:yes gene_type:complete
MFRTFAAAEFQNSFWNGSFEAQFKHLLELYNSKEKETSKKEAKSYFKCNTIYAIDRIRERINNTNGWKAICDSEHFEKSDISKVYSWLLDILDDGDKGLLGHLICGKVSIVNTHG